MYKLQKAKQNRENNKWYIYVSGNYNFLYLRPSMDISFGTNLPIGTDDIGYWDTEKKANKARKKFLRKQRLDNIDWYQEQFEKGIEVVVRLHDKTWLLCKRIEPKYWTDIRDIKLASRVHTYEQ